MIIISIVFVIMAESQDSKLFQMPSKRETDFFVIDQLLQEYKKTWSWKRMEMSGDTQTLAFDGSFIHCSNRWAWMGIDRFFVLIVSPIMTLVMRICLYHKKDMCALHTVQVSARIVSVLGDLAQIEWPHLANWSNKPEWKIIQEEIKQESENSPISMI